MEFKLKFETSELLKALELVRPGLASREWIEQSTHFAFTRGRVVTFNDEISICHPLSQSEGKEILQGTVNSNEIYNFLKRAPSIVVSIFLEDNMLVIRSGRSKVRLSFNPEIKLPLDGVVINDKKRKWIKLPDGFSKALSAITPICGQDLATPILTCVHIDIKNGVIEATDNIRIARVTLERINGNNSVVNLPKILLPRTAVEELIKYPIQWVNQGKEDWIHFLTTEKTMFSIRRVNGSFPDISSFLQVDGHQIRFPDGLDEALGRAEIFSKQKHNPLNEQVQVRIKEDKIKLHTESESAVFDETIKASELLVEKEINFVIHPNFFRQVSGHGAIIGNDRLKMERAGWEYIVALRALE
ncbi:MAG: hypothetical protein GWN01_09365 [Nitrosopumilaceae archaeon]|nr:hypothetical protein [Nitrosopumilaceae archaeon]NIU87818.1 hypothetical protein [Nitrosopumilaceae archaeon]NIV65200.1 hypothetical protein [Nitrosopumilaceae archaeon]NIX61716.1 hypothetical protein [Nitrosopumilaceae archaeon]